MKKITVLALAACMAFAVAVPAMAVEVDFSGSYRVRGFMNSNISLDDRAEESESYYDNRFRLQTVFKATDAVSVTTRFDAMVEDDVWGDTNNLKDDENEANINWDRVYMTIMSDVGMFMIGHQQAGVWGCDFFDDDYNDDRIKYVGKTGDFYFGAIIQKTEETDSVDAFDPDGESDADTDVYYLFGGIKQEGLEAGLLGTYARSAVDTDMTVTLQALEPYGKFTAGPVSVRGEIYYEFGEMDFDGSTADVDIDALSYALEGSFSLDMARLYLGWVSVSGQESGDDMTMGNTTYGGLGDDFNPLALLTDDLGGKMLNSKADLANIMSGGPFSSADVVALCGVDLLYAGADVTVNDKLSVAGIIGYAMANEDDILTGTAIDDVYGTEIDVTVKYQIMDNLEYRATLAYLMTEDLLAATKGVGPNNADDNFGIMHQIEVSF
ncbi:MAG: hypothetical protein SWC96_04505 [Thermodesulfobacteriota bacterium]|nr:hypothetical protein [Thermodesulfobacteriota bacterium]